MEFNIVFCTDGVLRIKFGNKPLIPASFIQQHKSYKSDFSFWAKWWEEYAIFEQGLTVGQFLNCLEPWSEFFQDLTGKNIQAFIEESRKPTLVTDTDEHPLTWVSLSYHTEISPSLEYDNSDRDMIDLNKWLNSPQKARLTGDWSIHSSYKLTGYSEGYEEQYGIDHCEMNTLANLPIILSKNHLLLIENYSAKRILGKDYEIFAPDVYGIKKVQTQSGYSFNYVEGEMFHRFRDLIVGFFWWFPSNPKRRQELNDSLKASIAELDHIGETEESNVIPLFKEDNDTDKKDTKLKVEVAPGAFDSIISYHDKQVSFWEEALESAKENNDVVLKIGEIKPASSPETRIYAHIIIPKDNKTEYKLI